MKTKQINKRVAAIAFIVILCICIGVIMFHRSKTLFHIDSSEVISITLENGDSKLTQMTITESSQVEDIVKLINDFTYTSSEKIPPSTGCGYYITLKTNSGGIGFEFWSSGIQVPDKGGEPGASINYYGEEGYFDALVALADSATDPI